MTNNSTQYVPTEEALKFISFIRAAGVEDNNSPEIHYRLGDKYFGKHKQVMIESFRGSAKALALDELVYKEDAEVTIKDVHVGDRIYDDTGILTTVVGKSEVFFKDTYEVEMIDGRSITCSGDHLWSVYVKAACNYKDSLRNVVKTTKELFEDQWYHRTSNYRNPKGREQKYSIQLNKPVQYKEQLLPIDPYTLGVIIGDGNVSKETGFSRITSHKDDIDELMAYIPYEKGIRSKSGDNAFIQGILKLGPRVKTLGLNVNTYNKFIPDGYKKGSIEQRIALVQGLMDTDGTIDSIKNKSSYFCSCNKKLAYDFMEVVRSLGTECRIRYEDNAFAGSWKVYIKHNTFNPFKLKRKACKVQYGKKLWAQKIKEIRKVATVPTQCIMVDNDSSLFLTSAYVVTHNSTLMEWYVIYAAVNGRVANFGTVNFIAFVGDSAEGGVKNFFRNVQTKIDRSSFLQQFLTIKRCTNEEAEFVNTKGHQLNIKGYGMRTNIRGVRYNGQRPEIIILDDVTTNEALTSETIRKTISDNFYKAIMPALHPTHYRLFVIGTPISENDILSKLRTNTRWAVYQFPIAKKFPCTREEFQGNWEDRFDYDAVLDKYETFKEDGELQSFYQEYMLEITDLSTLLVDEEDIQWFDPSQLVKYKGSYNFYIVTDFATSTKKSADFSTIGVVAVSSNNDWLLVDGQCLRQTMQENIDDLFKYVKKWKPLSVGIESSGQQGGFISILQEMMVSRNIWFTFAKKPGSKDPGIRPVKDKVHRFVTGVQPKFKQNKIWLPKPELAAKISPRLFTLVEEMLQELSKLTLAGGTKALAHDDACFIGSTPIAIAGGGYKCIKDIVSGDCVFNISNSLSSLTDGAIFTGHKEVMDYIFSDGSILTMTSNHPVLTDLGWITASDITSTHKVKAISWQENTRQLRKHMMDLNGHAENRDTTNVLQENKEEKNTYIGMYTAKNMGRYLKVFISIIKTAIRVITQQKIWSASQIQSIQQSTDSAGITSNNAHISTVSESLLTTHFTEVTKEKSSTRKTSNVTERKLIGNTIKHVGGVENLQEVNSRIKHPTVTKSANLVTSKLMDLKSLFVKYVKKLFCFTEKKPHAQKSVDVYTTGNSETLINTRVHCAEVALPVTEKLAESSVLKNVGLVVEKRCMTAEDVRNVELHINQKLAALDFVDPCVKNVRLERKINKRIEPVYNLSVVDGHNYLVAKGIVVHNCDLWNQLSEMDLYAPTGSEELTSSAITDDGLVWTSVWGDDEESDERVNNVIF